MKIFKRKNKISNSKISEGIPRNTVPFSDGHTETRYVEIDVKNDMVTLTDKTHHNFASMPAYGFSANEIANMITKCENIYEAATHFENVAVLNPFQKDESLGNVENTTSNTLPNLEIPKGPPQVIPTPNFNFKPMERSISNDTVLLFKYFDPYTGEPIREKRTVEETKKYIVSHWLDHTESNIGDGEFDSAIGWMKDATEVLEMSPKDFVENVLESNKNNYQSLEDIGLHYSEIFERKVKAKEIGKNEFILFDKNGAQVQVHLESIDFNQINSSIEYCDTLTEARQEVEKIEEIEKGWNIIMNDHDDVEPYL